MKRIRIVVAVAFVLQLMQSCGNAPQKADAYGSIEADYYQITTELPGRILFLYASEGDRVKRGEVLAQIDTVQLVLKRKQLVAKLEAIAAKYQGAKAQVEVVEEQLKTVSVDLERIKALYSDGAATKRQLDEVGGRYNVLVKQQHAASIQLTALDAEAKGVRAAIDQLNDQLARCRIVSPISGTVTVRFAQQGELAQPGRPIFRIASLDTLFARVYLDETQLPLCSIGSKVNLYTDLPGGEMQKHSGRIVWIASEAEFTPKVIQTRNERVNLVYAVKVKVVNNRGVLKVGMPVEMRFTTSKGTDE